MRTLVLAIALLAVFALLAGCTDEPTLAVDAAAPDPCCARLPDASAAETCARAELPMTGVCFTLACPDDEQIQVCTPRSDSDLLTPVTPHR